MTGDEESRRVGGVEENRDGLRAPPAEAPIEAKPPEHAPGEGRNLKGADLQAYIGRQLRAVYDDVAKQPVPDRFLELMKKLDAI